MYENVCTIVDSDHIVCKRTLRQERPPRGALRARTLGYPQALFVKLAMQAELDAAGIKLKIEFEAA